MAHNCPPVHGGEVTGDDIITLIINVVGLFVVVGITVQYVGWIGRAVGEEWLRWLLQIVPVAIVTIPLVLFGVLGGLASYRNVLLGPGVFGSFYIVAVLVVCFFGVIIESFTSDQLAYKERFWARRDGKPEPRIESLAPIYVRYPRYVWTGIRKWHEIVLQGL